MDTQEHNEFYSLREENLRLKKINKVLADKAEAEFSRQAGSYSLFETNAILREELNQKNVELDNAFRELRERQAQLWNSSKLSALGEIAAGIAHEINNPLSILMAYFHFLEEEATKDRPSRDKIKYMVAKSKETALRISSIVNGLRNISRDASNDPKKVTTPRKLASLALDISREKFKANGIDLSTGEDSKCWNYEVYANEVQMSQVLINLLNNAFDAIEKEQKPWVKIFCYSNQSYLHLCVSDSGPGIDLKAKGKLFEPFFTTKEIGKGTGLGLSVSKGLMRQQGGDLFLDEGRRETCFVMKLPRRGVQ